MICHKTENIIPIFIDINLISKYSDLLVFKYLLEKVLWYLKKKLHKKTIAIFAGNSNRCRSNQTPCLTKKKMNCFNLPFFIFVSSAEREI